MIWETKRVLVTVKAYPERSRKYGSSVCTVGLTDEEKWIRLFPIPLSLCSGPDKIRKYDLIEVECTKAVEKLSRKESYKIRPGSLRIIDRSLNEKKVKGKVDWAGRNKLILPHVSRSIDELDAAFREDRTSVGLIRPIEVMELYRKGELKIYRELGDFQRDVFGFKMPVIEEIPHLFGYRFRCTDCPADHSHGIQCEDWELLESYRSWGPRYKDTQTLWAKLHDKFYSEMFGKNLHFYMGMHSLQPSWLIIGLYYPPK